MRGLVYTFFYTTERLSSCTVQRRPDKTRLQTVLSIILLRTSLSDLSSCMAKWHFWVSSQAFLCPHRQSFKQPPCSPGTLPIKQINWWRGALWYCLTGAVVPEFSVQLVRGFLELSLENASSSEDMLCLWHFWFRLSICSLARFSCFSPHCLTGLLGSGLEGI